MSDEAVAQNRGQVLRRDLRGRERAAQDVELGGEVGRHRAIIVVEGGRILLQLGRCASEQRGGVRDFARRVGILRGAELEAQRVELTRQHRVIGMRGFDAQSA